jgi:hypothetical protein
MVTEYHMIPYSMLDNGHSVHADVFEPQRSAVLAIQPLLTIGETACDASLTLRAVRAVEEGYMLVSDVSKPMDLALVFEES